MKKVNISKVEPLKTQKSSEAIKTQMPKVKRLGGCGCGKKL